MHWPWVSLIIRSAVILAAAEVLSRLPRRATPVYRHRVVVVAFGLLAMWPLLAAVLPELHVPLWSQMRAHESVTVQQSIVALGRADDQKKAGGACDMLVVESGIRASDYATELLQLAQTFRSNARWASAAVLIGRRRGLEERLSAILASKQGGKTRRLPIVAVSVLTLLTVSASAVTFLPQK